VLRHLSKQHPGCPADIATEIAQRVVDREWRTKLTVGQAVGIVITTYIRHRLTDYERLLKVPGLTRDEARLIVAPELRSTLSAWRTPPDDGPQITP
jgi:hypothetical protein